MNKSYTSLSCLSHNLILIVIHLVSHQQSLIHENLLKCYAEEKACAISVLVVENCNGCIIDHRSQRQHSCLMMENEERLLMFTEMVNRKIQQLEEEAAQAKQDQVDGSLWTRFRKLINAILRYIRHIELQETLKLSAMEP